MTYFRGSELQNYFTRILEDNLKAMIKPQYVYHIPKAHKGLVGGFVDKNNERGNKAAVCDDLELNDVLDRNLEDLSGGELQRFAIAAVVMREVDVYIFDEPSSYLDVKQRLKAAKVIRSLLRPDSYVIVVEHDLSVWITYLTSFAAYTGNLVHMVLSLFLSRSGKGSIFFWLDLFLQRICALGMMLSHLGLLRQHKKAMTMGHIRNINTRP